MTYYAANEKPWPIQYQLGRITSMVDQNEFLIQLSEALSPLVWDAPLATLTPAEQVFVCVYEIEREVNNGGFDQFFRNSAGQYAAKSPQALEAIGATSMATIARQAVTTAFPDGEVPADRDEREDHLDAAGSDVESRLQELDEQFCRYPDDLTILLFQYVQKHHDSVRGARPA